MDTIRVRDDWKEMLGIPSVADVVALIPARNEAHQIADTLGSLAKQTTPPDHILVVADNCTDRTAQVVTDLGYEVFITHDNDYKKAGALNQALLQLLPTLDTEGYVLVMDADTLLNPEFIEVALSRTGTHIGAVGGSFYAKEEKNLLEILQANEYSRYALEISRRKNARANVLTGTGCLFRVDVLLEVQAARDCGHLPGSGIYKQDALTEDNELTLAIKTLGYEVISPKNCEAHTEAMSDLHSLWVQRIRWRRGSMEDFRAYGLTKTTAPYIGKMAWSMVVSLASVAYLGLVLDSFARGVNPFNINTFWLGLIVLYLVDRWWTVKSRPRRGIAVALIFPLELAYDVFQQAVFIKALLDFVRHTDQKWVHAPLHRRWEVR